MSARENPSPEDETADPEAAVAHDPIMADPDEAQPMREGGLLNNGQSRENLRIT